ncbi:hypothetical protein C8J57DRAFT_1501256 [Mycena rebaudengoi]|nr:hypothetical protein C8J57DRAFT_1501256 [Mycena rebaudengoi]
MGGGSAPPPIPNKTVSDFSSVEELLNSVRHSLKLGPPYSSGVHDFSKDLVVYYDVQGQAQPSRIDFLNATKQDISALAAACHGTQGHLEPEKFSTRLGVVDSGLIDVLSTDLLQGQNVDNNKSLRVKMQGLDICGPGFTVNKQGNPVGPDNVVASLVVVLPVVHAGGAFTIEHGGTTWNFDPSTNLSRTTTSLLPYVALYHDVAHTIAPVQSGHRVTLTYNLFLVDRNPAAPSVRTTAEHELENKLRSLLAAPSFLPAGGFLAFSLAHKYPLPPPQRLDLDWDAPWSFETGGVKPRTSAARWDVLLQALRGSDARFRAISQRVGLVPVIKLLYTIGNKDRTGNTDMLLDEAADLSEVYEYIEVFEMATAEEEVTKQGVVLGRDAHRKAQLEEKMASELARYPPHCRPTYTQQNQAEDEVDDDEVATHWLTDRGENNCVLSAYAGQDSLLDYKTGIPTLFVPVPAVGEGLRGAVVMLES